MEPTTARALKRTAIAAVMLLFAACSSAGPSALPTTSATPSPSPSPTPLRAPADRCGPPDLAARPFWFPAKDGTLLDGVIVGKGPRGILLLHEYPSELCGWWPYAVSMAKHGFHVMLFDFRCYGYSTCPRALRGRFLDDTEGALVKLRSEGAAHIALIGASLGGVVALMAGPVVQPPVDVVVSVSGEPSLVYVSGTPPLDATTAVPHLGVPTLYLVSKGDNTVSVEDTQALYRATKTSAKQIAVFESGF
ncbi:MAG: alpha/beta hydrolase family protein, partial [Actinomycetota bacterium]